MDDSSRAADFFPPDLLEKFEIHNYNHALEILTQSFRVEFGEVLDTLREVNLCLNDILEGGGNESPIPPKFGEFLYPKGWKEIRITGDLVVKFYPRKGNKKGVFSDEPYDKKTINEYIDGHNIDYVKGRVALDFEWNSKDQTFDRDLFAMRTYYECNVISAGIIITRSKELDDIFRVIGINSKYGASTTWMGKLLPRLESRRNGGCPILAIGIRKKCFQDWREKNG